MGSADIILTDSGYSIADFNRSTIIDGTALSGAQTFDMKTVDANDPVTLLVITGAIPAGVSINVPTNVPVLEQCAILFTAPGTEPVPFNSFLEITNLPVHTAGKAVYYEFKRVPVDGTPANDVYLLSGTIEGGTTFSATGLPDIPSPGVEVSFRSHPAFGDTFLQSWSGTMDSNIVGLGGAIDGTMNRIISKGGDAQPTGANSNQRWSLPYVATPESTYWDVQIQNNSARLIAGDMIVSNAPTFHVWLEYSKV